MAGVIEEEGDDPAVKDELGALAIDFKVFQTVQREGDALEAFVVVADETVLFGGAVGPEIITARGEDDFGGVSGTAAGQGGEHGRGGVATVTGFGTEGVDIQGFIGAGAGPGRGGGQEKQADEGEPETELPGPLGKMGIHADVIGGQVCGCTGSVYAAD